MPRKPLAHLWMLVGRIIVDDGVDEPKWVYSNFVKGYETLPVRIPG
jgi:hypothetical protein